MPSAVAASCVRSMMRPGTKGPRSLMRTWTEAPLLRLVTRTIVSIGSVRCAAVILSAPSFSPLAVRTILRVRSYQEARPVWAKRGRPTRSTGVEGEASGGVIDTSGDGAAQAASVSAVKARAINERWQRVADPEREFIAIGSAEMFNEALGASPPR